MSGPVDQKYYNIEESPIRHDSIIFKIDESEVVEKEGAV